MTTLEEIRKKMEPCMQCGTCTASCINSFAMDITPRHLWRLVLMGDEEAVFRSRSFSICSSCYYCTLRCPQGLPLTETMAALKRIATGRKAPAYRISALFNKAFLKNLKKNGRISEMELMNDYFIARKNPLLPLKFASLGIRLLKKGKVGFGKPSTAGSHAAKEVAAIFEKAIRISNPDT